LWSAWSSWFSTPVRSKLPGDVSHADRRLSGVKGRKAQQRFGLYGLRKKSGPGKKDVPQGLKPVIFSIVDGPTKVVP
jgi:hypothetical protein